MQYDKEFLLKLDKDKNKIIYARIESLQIDESPIETIEGRVTQGSINIDGTSAVRRSCSLTLVAQDYNYKDYYWGLKTKFHLSIGLENNVDSQYPKIIWFDQGIYLITSLNTSNSANNFTMSISGKDKMCLLNGDIGGAFNSSIDFGTLEEENEDGTISITKIPIPEIIRNMIHQYAGEPFHNIIINDLDMLGLELLEYRYDTPMYLYRSKDSYIYNNATLDGKIKCRIEGTLEDTTLDKLTPNELDMLVSPLSGSTDPKIIIIEDKEYYIAKIEYGQTAGYRATDLVYPGDLIANIGDKITTILDKIKNMLGEFEYFYDIYGRFTFQKKASLVNTFWTPGTNADDENETKESLASASIYAYIFSQGELITAFNNNPNLANLKNDYSIWGNRTSTSGAEIPVHMRYAIDKKPVYYKNFKGQLFMTNKDLIEKLKEEKKQSILQNIKERINNFKMLYTVPQELTKPVKKADNSWTPGWWDIRDWYNFYMALTLEEPRYSMKWYSQRDLSGCVLASSLNIEYTATLKDNAYVWLLIKNKDSNKYNAQHGSGDPASGGRDCIKWEAYYDDEGKLISHQVEPKVIENFIRPYSDCSDSHTFLHFLINDVEKAGNSVYFYNPSFPTLKSFEEMVEEQIEKEFDNKLYNYVDWREIIYQMALDFYQYNNKDNFENILRENNEEYYPTGQTGYEQYYIDLQGFWRQLYNPLITNEDKDNFYPEDHQHAFWNKNVYEHPELLNFWFDFLDTEGELSQFSVKNVGVRANPINDNNVKSIYFRETPSIIYGEKNLTGDFTAYKWIQVADESIDSMFSISSQGLSAKDKLDESIYQHGYCIESATITTIPIYYLQPNTRIYLFDEKANLEGDYIISKITIPLSYNGTMSITATKAANNII